MADKRRFLDVWIVESNTVYREVPFTVVADWVQQGRLLEDDMLKPSGTAEWYRVGGSADFAPYLPKPQPLRSDDQAEAMEPVQLDFTYKKRHDEEDDDPDMIPLIDVTLVLLIFFMLTASASAVGSTINLPGALHPNVVNVNPEEITVGIDLDDDKRTPIFSIGIGNHPPSEDARRNIRDYQELLNQLGTVLAGSGTAEVTINAHKDVRSGIVRKLTADLGRAPFGRLRVRQVLIGVNEVQP